MSATQAGQATMRVGAAVVGISPPAGTPMAGFAARTEPSTGVHDPLTVRALAVEDTCLITVDVCGLHEDTCTRIAHGLPFVPDRVAITATHTHAGPCVIPGRLGGHDPGLLEEIVLACREAAEAAVDSQQPATLYYGESRGVDVRGTDAIPNAPWIHPSKLPRSTTKPDKCLPGSCSIPATPWSWARKTASSAAIIPRSPGTS